MVMFGGLPYVDVGSSKKASPANAERPPFVAFLVTVGLLTTASLTLGVLDEAQRLTSENRARAPVATHAAPNLAVAETAKPLPREDLAAEKQNLKAAFTTLGSLDAYVAPRQSEIIADVEAVCQAAGRSCVPAPVWEPRNGYIVHISTQSLQRDLGHALDHPVKGKDFTGLAREQALATLTAQLQEFGAKPDFPKPAR